MVLQRPLVAGWQRTAVVPTQDSALRQYQKAEFEGGGCLLEVVTEWGETAMLVKPSLSEPAGRRLLRRSAFQESSRDVRPRKAIRTHPKFAPENALSEL